MTTTELSYRPKYPRPDANQPQIVSDLERLGFCVINVSSLPVPALDLFVGGWNCRTRQYAFVQVEVKVPGKKLSPSERRHFDRWPDLPIIVAYKVEDVLAWFGR